MKSALFLAIAANYVCLIYYRNWPPDKHPPWPMIAVWGVYLISTAVWPLL